MFLWMLFDLIVQIHNMHNIQQLTFVFVETFYLYVKDRSWIYFDSVVLQNIFCQTLFVLILNIHEFLTSLRIIGQRLQSTHQRQVCDPVLGSKLFGYPVSKKRVTMHQETSLRDTICLVVELLWHHLVEIF